MVAAQRSTYKHPRAPISIALFIFALSTLGMQYCFSRQYFTVNDAKGDGCQKIENEDLRTANEKRETLPVTQEDDALRAEIKTLREKMKLMDLEIKRSHTKLKIKMDSTNILPQQHHNQSHAVVHMGPHKTGTSTLQVLSDKISDQLKDDGYEMPWFNVLRDTDNILEQDRNQVQFANCFLHFRHTGRNKYNCVPELLLDGLNIARRKKNVFVTAEAFANVMGKGFESLSTYLSNWDRVTIVLYYRRYYDYVQTSYNQVNVKRSIKSPATWSASKLDYISRYTKKPPHIYTGSLLQRLRKEFDNIVVMNFHDKSRELSEVFFCDAMPGAHHACNAVRNSVPMVKNVKEDLCYKRLVWGAKRRGLVQIKTDEEMSDAAKAVKYYVEKTLKLTIDDLELSCLSPQEKKDLLDRSLEFEMEIMPELFKSPLGETQLRSDFEIQVKSTKLCEVNVNATLEKKEWQLFFKSLRNSI